MNITAITRFAIIIFASFAYNLLAAPEEADTQVKFTHSVAVKPEYLESLRKDRFVIKDGFLMGDLKGFKDDYAVIQWSRMGYTVYIPKTEIIYIRENSK